jgi:hypothetical protein
MEFIRKMLKDQLHLLKGFFLKKIAKMLLICQHFSSKFHVLEFFQVLGMFKNFVKNLWKKIQPKKVLK